MSHCPQCGETHSADGEHCDRCGAQLASEVEVLRTSEVAAIPVLKSILQSAEIPYYTQGEVMMQLFPSELLAPSLMRPRGEVRFFVAAEHADHARQLLTPIDGADLLPDDDLEDP